MADGLSVLDTDKIIASLLDLSGKTEEIFLKFAFSLPALFREVESGINKANDLLQVFSKKSTPLMNIERNNEDVDIVTRGELLIGDATNFFSNLEQRDNELFQAINISIDWLSLLEDRFSDIREDSNNMEVVSLNAKIAALKAGKHSGGFAYISNELLKVSSKTTKNTNTLTSCGEDVIRSLKTFTGKIETIQNELQSFYEHFKGNIKNIFSKYNLEVEGLVNHLTSAIGEAERVKGPLNNIMENIQIQDIIRQSLEHVEMVLKELGIKNVSDSPDRILDQLTFVEILNLLCNDLLEDIQNKLAESINTLSVNTGDLRNTMEKVNRDSEYIKDLLGSEVEEDNSREDQIHIVSESVDSLEVLLNNLGKSLQKKNDIPVDANQIINILMELERGFIKSLEIVSQLYPLNINAKIQVAKWDILDHNGAATSEISYVSNKINLDMETTLQLIRKIKNEIETAVNLYTKGNADEICAINRITDRIKECYAGFSQSSRVLSDTICSFSVYSNSFFTLLDNMELDIEKLSELIDLITNIRRILNDSEQEAGRRKKKLLLEMGLKKWVLKDRKLEEIAGRFTIYAHKRTAENIAGIDIIESKEAGEAGELTLF